MNLQRLNVIYMTLLRIDGELRHRVETQCALSSVRDEIARRLMSPVEIVQNIYEKEVAEEIKKEEVLRREANQ